MNVEPGINVIYGKNGFGKTNILEAMFLCCIGKSFRTSHDSEMIRQGEYEFKVQLKIDDNLFGSIAVSYNKKKQKVVKVDGVCLEKLRFLMGKLNGIIFSPETMSLINEGPAERRKFLDVALCQMSGNYFYALSLYNKFLNEKTALIADKFKPVDPTTLEILNEKLASLAADIIFARDYFLSRAGKYSSDFYENISGKRENLVIKPVYSVPGLKNYFIDVEKSCGKSEKKEIEKIILNELNSEVNRKKETDYGKCFIGPHRDDFDCVMNGLSLKSYGSQGQKRSAVVALKLSELEIMKETSGRVPVLFLDDVLSELDRERKNKILELTKNYQTFITCTDRDIAEDIISAENSASARVKYINVENLIEKC